MYGINTFTSNDLVFIEFLPSQEKPKQVLDMISRNKLSWKTIPLQRDFDFFPIVTNLLQERTIGNEKFKQISSRHYLIDTKVHVTVLGVRNHLHYANEKYGMEIDGGKYHGKTLLSWGENSSSRYYSK